MEVIGKRLCDSQIGEIIAAGASIAQDGREATLIIDPDVPISLTVNGRRASGRSTRGSATNEFALEVSEGELRGTMTFTDSSVPCTEVLTLTGTRDNEPPSGAFAGDWDFQLEVTESACDDVPMGETESVCRRVRVDNSTVTVEDDEGPIRGVGDGPIATLRRTTEDERLTLCLHLDGDQILGEFESYDLVEQCYTTRSVVGTRRDQPCRDYAGS